MNLFDLSGSIASLLSTLLFISVKRLAWAITVFATLLNGWLYWKKGIYADMGLEFAYFSSAIYGWITWKSAGNTPNTKITTLTSVRDWSLLLLAFCLLFGCFWYFLTHHTSTTVGALDAATTALSLTAQWLMCRKIIVTWILWFITDIIYAYLYYIKALPFHTGLMLIYTVLAVIGYYNWHRQYKVFYTHSL